MPEVYQDQFTPWVPNHLIDKQNIPIDIFGGAILGRILLKDQEGLTSVCNHLYSVVLSNFYLAVFQENSTKPEDQ